MQLHSHSWTRVRQWVQDKPLVRATWGRFRWYSSLRGQESFLIWLAHLGWQVTCPICGWKGRRFYPNPMRFRAATQNAICPSCHAHARHRLLFLFLRQCTSLFFRNQLRVLDIAPGRYSSRICRNAPKSKLVSIDLQSSIANCNANLTSLPFRDGSFDLIICYHVLEHIAHDCNDGDVSRSR